MGKTIYLECNTGISGDMTVAALLDLGASQEKLEAALRTIPAQGFEIKVSRVKKAGIDCMDFDVVLDAAHENHDHDMDYLHGHDHNHGDYHRNHDHDGHNHDHNHEDHHHDHNYCDHHHDHNHDHEHGDHHHNHDQYACEQHAQHSHEIHSQEPHDHEHHHHHHEHRGLNEVNAIIDACQMTDRARNLAKKIFLIVAASEAKAHATTLEKVHFHEVGAIDSIVDVISVAVCMDDLDITDVIVSKLCEGCGTVRCQHGILPIPVPAVANILASYPLQVNFTKRKGEFITPTGAAIAAAVQTKQDLPEKFRVKKIGYGAGKRAYEVPSILRIMWIEEITKKEQDTECIYKLESNIDDSTGELLGYAMEKLFEAGARDVHYHPVFMKKNRPGWQLNVICTKDKVEELETIIYRETTTIGIRRMPIERSYLERELRKVETSFGEIQVKVCMVDGKERIYIEHESIAAICKETGLSYVDVEKQILKEI